MIGEARPGIRARCLLGSWLATFQPLLSMHISKRTLTLLQRIRINEEASWFYRDLKSTRRPKWRRWRRARGIIGCGRFEGRWTLDEIVSVDAATFTDARKNGVKRHSAGKRACLELHQRPKSR